MAKQKTMLTIVNELRNAGHTVSYTKRTDGGIRIKSIDNIKFSGSKGNTYARNISGVTISKARSIQLERNQKYNKQTRQSKKPTLPSDIKRQIQRTQRVWRKTHTTSEGFITTRKVRWIIEHYGEEEAKRRLQQAENYARGYTYEGNVDALISRIEIFKNQRYPKGNAPQIIQAVIDKIKSMRSKFPHKYIVAINEIQYDIEQRKRVASELYINDRFGDILRILNNR